MALEFEVQIRDYATFLREEGSVQLDEVLDSMRDRAPSPTPPSRWRPVVVALAAAAIVLVLIGGLALLLRLPQEVPVVDEDEVPTTTTVPGPDSLGTGPVVLDSTGDVGHQPEVLIGNDGLPLVAYVDETKGVVKLAKCTDPGCADAVVSELGPVSEAISHGPSVAVGSDGLPLIMFSTGDELVIHKCLDLACSSDTATRITGGGQSPIVATAPDAMPFMAFSNNNGDLVVLKCGETSCSTNNLVTAIATREPDGPGFEATWVGFTTDDLPVVGYQSLRFGPDGLPILRGSIACLDPACTSHEEAPSSPMPTLSPGSVVGAMTTGPTGQSIQARYEVDGEGNRALAVIACTDATCSTGTTTIIGEFSSESPDEPSVMFNSEGLPMIFHFSGDELKLAVCSDVSCMGEVTIRTLIEVGGISSDLATAMGAGGNPFLAYYSNSDLNVMACSDPTCSELAPSPAAQAATSGELWVVTKLSEGEVATADFNTPLTLDASGLVTVAYVEDKGHETPAEVRVVHCLNQSCSETVSSPLGLEAWALNLASGPGSGMTLVHQNFETISVTHCTDAACSSHETSELSETGTWPHLGVVRVSDTGLVLSYQDWNDYYPRLVRCDGTTCSPEDVGTQIRIFENSEGVRLLMNTLSFGIPPSGPPYLLVVEGREEGNAVLRLVHCLDATCTNGDPILLDDTLLDTATAAMVMSEDGFPLIAYYVDGSLTVVKCDDSECSQRSTTIVGPAIAEFIASVAPSIAFGPTGNPVIAFWNPQRHLMLADCFDAACTESSLVDFGDVGSYSLRFGPDGLPILVYHSNNELWFAKCQDPACLEP